ncbi:MAG: heme NO-binding domain-containing protein [Candidatus Binatia bacterium]
MKGIVFNLLEEVVRREHGEDVWDRLLEAAHLDGVYTSLGNYHDEELLKLVEVASAALHIPADAVVRWFGRSALPLLAEKYPAFFKPHESTRSFLLTLNTIIHPEVRRIYPGADVPIFDFDSSASEVLVLGYSSRRKLCAFGEGLIAGAAAHYGETAGIEQPLCMNRGDPRCVFRISFQKPAP